MANIQCEKYQPNRRSERVKTHLFWSWYGQSQINVHTQVWFICSVERSDSIQTVFRCPHIFRRAAKYGLLLPKTEACVCATETEVGFSVPIGTRNAVAVGMRTCTYLRSAMQIARCNINKYQASVSHALIKLGNRTMNDALFYLCCLMRYRFSSEFFDFSPFFAAQIIFALLLPVNPRFHRIYWFPIKSVANAACSMSIQFIIIEDCVLKTVPLVVPDASCKTHKNTAPNIRLWCLRHSVDVDNEILETIQFVTQAVRDLHLKLLWCGTVSVLVGAPRKQNETKKTYQTCEQHQHVRWLATTRPIHFFPFILVRYSFSIFFHFSWA